MGEKWTEEANKYLLQRYDDGAPPRVIVEEMVARGLRVNPDPGPLNDHLRELRGMRSRRRMDVVVTTPAPVKKSKPKRKAVKKPRDPFQGQCTITVKTSNGCSDTFPVKGTTLLNVLIACIKDQPEGSPWRSAATEEPKCCHFCGNAKESWSVFPEASECLS